MNHLLALFEVSCRFLSEGKHQDPKAVDARIARLEKLHDKVKNRWTPDQVNAIKRELTKLHISKITGRHPSTLEKKQPALQYLERLNRKSMNVPSDRPEQHELHGQRIHTMTNRLTPKRSHYNFWPKEVKDDARHWEVTRERQKVGTVERSSLCHRN